MRKRLVRALIFAVVTISAAVGAAGAAGAIDHGGSLRAPVPDGIVWD
jgi:hypothetical protein